MEGLSTTNDCQELKNIKYKTMLLNGAPLHETKSANDLSNLDAFLENEKNNNVNEPWCKLNKTIKMKKLQDFVTHYKDINELSDAEGDLLLTFLKECVDRKKIQRVKDVLYDKTNGTIKEIPALHYVKASRHFTLKNMDKRVSTLKSLAPNKTTQGSIRKKEIVKTESDSDEDNDK